MANRRTFLASLAALGALAAHAQPARKIPRVGYITLRSAPATFDRAFVQALAELGYVDGRNVTIEFRFAANDVARLERMAADLAASAPDVVVVMGPAIHVMSRATRTVPLVMAAAADPIGQGFVASLARPGGNLTGVSIQSTDLAQKRLQLLRELVPGAKRIAVLAVSTGAAQASQREGYVMLFDELRAVAKQADFALTTRLVGKADELPDAFAQFRREGAQALVVQVHPRFFEHRKAIYALANEQRLPTLYEIRDLVEDGGLVSYGPDLSDAYRRTAAYVDKILRGAKPGDLAIEQPAKLELVVNLRAAKAIGLSVPQALLLRADEVIR